MGLWAQPSIIALNATGRSAPCSIAGIARKSAAFSQRLTKPLARFRPTPTRLLTRHVERAVHRRRRLIHNSPDARTVQKLNARGLSRADGVTPPGLRKPAHLLPRSRLRLRLPRAARALRPRAERRPHARDAARV